jgi:hypothetical protein
VKSIHTPEHDVTFSFGSRYKSEGNILLSGKFAFVVSAIRSDPSRDKIGNGALDRNGLKKTFCDWKSNSASYPSSPAVPEAWKRGRDNNVSIFCS